MMRTMSTQVDIMHSFQSLPEIVRKSAPIRALAEKLVGVTNGRFEYASELCQLYNDVKPEVARMALLFPEYTPHDAELHLDRLFELAEKLFGAEFFSYLNCDELFLFCTGLIAHDWGMALGNPEIDALVEGANLPESQQIGFALLDDEKTQLTRYISEKRLPLEGDRCSALTQAPPIHKDDGKVVVEDARHAIQHSPLPEYIRRTHAWRSGARLIRRWGKEFPVLAESAAAVCIGHWLDLAKIDSAAPFSTPRPIVGSNPQPNLRVLAVLVRLTDLFDIGSDRTPYALWRFIQPQDVVSRREWDKHRCLDPVVAEYDSQQQRTPVLSGRVTDHEVWAAILDLKRYCEEQLRGCCDLIRRHLHADSLQRGHHLPWSLRSEVFFRVEPINFKPLDIRFEFDRQNILNLLGTLLYRGDAYVFLRELLQNAVDATRLRYARHQLEQESDPSSRPPRNAIYFDVKHAENGNAVVTCRDAGIGMDDVIVRNYMAKAGASFWQSDQFQHMNPGFTPIGRFGIGMLSCFSVADEIEIITRRYDWPDPNSDPLRICIPNVVQQFRVETAPDETPPGTSVTVRVKGEKLRDLWSIRNAVEATKKIRDNYPIQPLQVTAYIKRIAGFVRFPIVVDEHGQRTIIVHPDYEDLPETVENGSILPFLEAEAKRKGFLLRPICRLSRNYDWSFRTSRNSIGSLYSQRHLLSQSVVDMVKDLGPELKDIGRIGIEGWLTHPDVSDPNMMFDSSSRVIDPFDLESITSSPHDDQPPLLVEPNHHEPPLESPSCENISTCRVYRDGLLVPGIVEPKSPTSWDAVHRDYFNSGYKIEIKLNLSSGNSSSIDPSRLNLVGLENDWADYIWESRNKWISRTGKVNEILASTIGTDQHSQATLLQAWKIDSTLWLGT
jgi:hypothetical protein